MNNVTTEDLNVRLDGLRERMYASYATLSVENKIRVDSIRADVVGLLVIREQLRGFIPDEELSTTSLELLGHVYAVGAGHLEDHGTAIAAALEGIASSMSDIAQALDRESD
jgi:hypothetical protein